MVEPHSTHASLLSRVRDPADRRAWREFDARYGELIRRYCRGCGLQLSDAEDVRQMVMMHLAAALPAFCYDPQRGRFRSYLYRMVRHAIVRQMSRHKGREIALDHHVLETNADDATDGDVRWEAQWVRHHCRMALETLRLSVEPRSAAVFEHLLAGHGIAETARTFGLTDAGVRKIKQRVKKRLELIVARQLHDEDDHG